MKKEKIHTMAIERFKEASEAEDYNRGQALELMRFEHGEQWSEEDKQRRKGRPCLTINKAAGSVKQIIGDARQNKLAIKVRPVDDKSDVEIAKIMTGLIRNIENISDAETAYDNGFENAVRGNIGYWRIVTDYSTDDTFDQDILIERVVNPHSVYLDPAARKADRSDIRYAFITDRIPMEEFKREYKKHAPEDIDTAVGDSGEDWYNNDDVRIAEYFYKEEYTKKIYMLNNGDVIEDSEAIEELGGGKFITDQHGQKFMVEREREVQCDRVMWCKMTGSTIIEGPKEWAGKYIPIVACLGEEIWIDGKLYLRGALHHATDPQRLYNWARSNAVEYMAMAPKQPFMVTPDQIEGHESQWNKLNETPMPYLLYNQVDGQNVPARMAGSFADNGSVQEAMMAADDIKATTGLFDASLGARGNETSGKAIQARERQGDTATFIFTDNLARAIKYTGKILVDLIPKIYDTERVVRLLNPDNSEAWAEINKAVRTSEGFQVVNDLSFGKYDVVVDIGPSFSTKRIEAAEGMIQLVQSAPNYAPIIMPRLAKNLDWPEADEIAEEMQAMNQPQQDPRMEMEAAKGQLDVEGKQLANAKKKQDLQKQGGEMQMQMIQIAQGVVVETLQQLGILPTGRA